MRCIQITFNLFEKWKIHREISNCHSWFYTVTVCTQYCPKKDEGLAKGGRENVYWKTFSTVTTLFSMSFPLFEKIEGDLDTSHWCRKRLFFVFVIKMCDKRYIDFKHFCHTKLVFLDFAFSENQFLLEFHYRFHCFLLIMVFLDFPNGYYQKVLCWKVVKWILAILWGFDELVKYVLMVLPIALEFRWCSTFSIKVIEMWLMLAIFFVNWSRIDDL